MGGWGETAVLNDIAAFLPTRDRARCVAVCKKWRIEAGRASLWTSLDARKVFSTWGDGGCVRLRTMLGSARFASVEEINFECCKRVTDLELATVPSACLKRLNLNALHNVTPQAVEALIRRSPKLEALQLYWHPRLTNSVLSACAEFVGETLLELNVSGCGDITDRGIESLLTRCRKIKKLNITRCPKLTDGSLRRIAETLGPLLTDLNCYADSGFTDAGYGALAISAPSLQKLDVCGARMLTSPALGAVVERCGANLRSLNCSWCVLIDDVAGLALARHAPRLELLSFHGILNVTDATIDALSASPAGKTLTTFDVNGCANVTDYRRRLGVLVKKFPNVTCWVIHQ